jgi:hypothetical protein
MEASIDGEKVEHLEDCRVRSEIFDLNFPDENVDDVKPGLTRSVCDGYWVFIRPLHAGIHHINFKGENLLLEPYTTSQLKSIEVSNQIRDHINENSTFKLDVSYEILIE